MILVRQLELIGGDIAIVAADGQGWADPYSLSGRNGFRARATADAKRLSSRPSFFRGSH